MGATGVVAMTGVFFIIGFDALFIVVGGLAGFVLMAVMLAPFLRKFGAFTVPSYLGRRFDSVTVRILCAALVAVPMLLLLVAELRMGSFVAAWLVGQPQSLMVVLLVFCIVLGLIFGGMRSFAWSSSAQAIAAILALIVPVAIVAVMVTNFPLPQLTQGPLLRELVRNEAIQGLPIVDASSFAFMLPGDGMLPVAKRFTAPFGSVGPAAFVVAMLTVAAGVASAPWLLPRVTMTPGVYETRKALGWATVFFGLVMLTVASISVFMRDYLMDIVAVAAPTEVPDWLRSLTELGLAQIDTRSTRLAFASFSFWRDAVFLSLPIAAGLPSVFVYFAAAGGVAAALVAAGAVVGALGNVIAEDVINGLSWKPLPSAV
jgi:cation/acetate symporter